jgi:hypothetical protein
MSQIRCPRTTSLCPPPKLILNGSKTVPVVDRNSLSSFAQEPIDVVNQVFYALAGEVPIALPARLISAFSTSSALAVHVGSLSVDQDHEKRWGFCINHQHKLGTTCAALDGRD